MDMESYDAAFDHYIMGFNSLRGKKFLSMRDLALDPDLRNAQTFSVHTKYFNDKSNYADYLILSAMTSAAPFSEASPEQKREIVTGALKGMVLYMYFLQKMDTAATRCGSDDSFAYLDEAVAVWSGSIEGPNEGGDYFGEGESIYALAYNLCSMFGTCSGIHEDNAEVNVKLLKRFKEFKAALLSKDCTNVMNMAQEVELLVQVPLFQAAIFYASKMEGMKKSGTSAVIGSGHIMAKSILPIIDAVDKKAAMVISTNTEFTAEGDYMKDGSVAVFDAFATAISKMNGFDCALVGELNEYKFCEPSTSEEIKIIVPPDEPGSKIEFQHIAFDIRDMRLASNATTARNIYTNGKHYQNIDGSGLQSLSSFSSQAEVLMRGEPFYNLYAYGVKEIPTVKENENNNFRYADIVINDIFDELENSMGDTADSNFAADATVALNVWMFVVHKLYDSLFDCRDGKIDGLSFGEGISFYIGEGQNQGGINAGYLLYSLAEDMGSRFGQIGEDGESAVNSNIMNLFVVESL